MSASGIQITCPNCHAVYRLGDRLIKEIVKEELLCTDGSADMQQPVRELLSHILEDGGAKKMASDLAFMMRGKDSTPSMKLAAMRILTQLLKQYEENADKVDFSMVDKKELSEIIDRKLKIIPTAPLPPEIKAAQPKWMEKIQEKKELKDRSTKPQAHEMAEVMQQKYSGELWFVSAQSERAKDGTMFIVAYVMDLMAVPTDLMAGDKSSWGGFRVEFRVVKPKAEGTWKPKLEPTPLDHDHE